MHLLLVGRSSVVDPYVAREHELHQAVKDYKTQLDDVTLSLADYKRRALDAEVCLCLFTFWSSVLFAMQLQLDENKSSASRTSELEQEVKEKNLLIGKLRHEG